MELSRERKIFIGIFATALAALGIDRGLLGPSEASAAPSVVAQPAVAPMTQAGVGAAPTGNIGNTLALFAERLQGLGDGFEIDPVLEGDAFKVPAAWLEVEEPETARAAPKTPEGPPSLRLTSVMPTQRGGIAVLEGKTYRQGETIGDFVLEAVEPRSVVLRRGEQLYRVGLSDR